MRSALQVGIVVFVAALSTLEQSLIGQCTYSILYIVIVTIVCHFTSLRLYLQSQPLPGSATHLSDTVIYFDGVCNFCNDFVNFSIECDSRAHLRFGSIQKHTAKLISIGAGKYAIGGTEALTTIVLVQKDRVYTKSAAACRALAMLDWPYNYLAGLYALPEGLRDLGYTLFAEKRYMLFGQTEQCRDPDKAMEKRFL